MPWFPFGPDGGDARAFAADPQDHTHIYLGTINGSIYESHDGGKKWTRLARLDKRDDLVIKKILVDSADPKHLLVGAYALGDHPDGGLFVSHDSGATWKSQPDMRGQSIRSLTESRSDPTIMVAGSLEGVFRSMDSGAHWEQISPVGDKDIREIESLAIDPADAKTIYAGTWHLPWKTTDGGEHWVGIKDGIIEDSDVFSIVIEPKQPNVVYLSACSGIYKSENGGAKFTGGVVQNKAQGIPSSARRTRVLMQDPNHPSTVLAGTTEGLYRTDDDGKLWMPATGSDIIVNDVYIDPTDSKHVLLATDRSGVLVSDDGGDTFTPSNRGFQARQITAYVADAQHPATVYVGVVNDKAWGGVFVSRSGGLSWSQLSNGLEGHDVFSLGQAPDGTILAGTGHGMYRLQDTVWQRVEDDHPPANKGGAGAPLTAADALDSAAKLKAESLLKAEPPLKAPEAHPDEDERTGVPPHVATPAARSRAAKARGAKAKPAPEVEAKGFNGSVYGFALSDNTVYAGTSEGMLRSLDSGTTWKEVPSLAMEDWRLAATKPVLSLPAAEWRFISVSKLDVLAASLDAIVLSQDAGTTWQAVSMPAAIVQVNAASVDGLGQIWIGGREGLFFSKDKGVTWNTLESLPIRNANSIYFDQKSNRILVTSNGTATVSAIHLPDMKVSYLDTGWNLRLVRPVGDYLVGITPFDGVVVQPRMVDSSEVGTTTAQR
jgi:photosystem II stability/assembly factor-like uncharacterized protein